MKINNKLTMYDVSGDGQCGYHVISSHIATWLLTDKLDNDSKLSNALLEKFNSCMPDKKFNTIQTLKSFIRDVVGDNGHVNPIDIELIFNAPIRLLMMDAINKDNKSTYNLLTDQSYKGEGAELTDDKFESFCKYYQLGGSIDVVLAQNLSYKNEINKKGSPVINIYFEKLHWQIIDNITTDFQQVFNKTLLDNISDAQAQSVFKKVCSGEILTTKTHYLRAWQYINQQNHQVHQIHQIQQDAMLAIKLAQQDKLERKIADCNNQLKNYEFLLDEILNTDQNNIDEVDQLLSQQDECRNHIEKYQRQLNEHILPNELRQ